MTTVKISQLTASLGVSGSDLFMSAVGSLGNYVTKKVTATQLAAHVTSSIVNLNLSSISGSTAQFTTVTGSTVTGTLATFTSVTASQLLSTSDLTVNSLTVGRGNSAGSQNTAMGITALSANTAGNYNAAFGFEALKANTSGIANTAIGRNALSANTIGSYNTAMGNYALGRNIGGNQNIAIGHDCMPFNTSGQYNVAVGVAALYSITNGSYNTAIGQASLASNTANNNTAVGYNSLNGNGAGTSNTAVGAGALQTNSSANNNTAVGYQALLSNTIGSTNTALGVNALRSNVNASYNTAIGLDALYSNNGASNTAVGYNALRGNTTGYWNIAIGEDALLANTTGYYNVAIGIDALNTATSSFYNIAVGDSALYDTDGSSNIGVGAYAAARQIGTDNVAIGSYAMGRISSTNRNSGSNNIAIGSNAGLRTSGSNNIMIGYGAGSDLRSGSNNIFLGYQAYQMNVSDTFILTLGANERMRINSAGNLGVGSSNPASLLSVGASSQFQVDSSGNIVKLRNVTTSFPSSQGSAGTLLQNDGAGNLSWVAASGLSAGSSTNSTNTTNINITDTTSSPTVHYPVFVDSNTGNLVPRVDSTGFIYTPSTNTLSSSNLVGKLFLYGSTSDYWYNLTFADNTGHQDITIDGNNGLIYNPGIRTLRVRGSGSIETPTIELLNTTSSIEDNGYIGEFKTIARASGSNTGTRSSVRTQYVGTTGEAFINLLAGNANDVNLSSIAVFGNSTGIQLKNNISASGHIIPSSNSSYDLGVSGGSWRDLYVTNSPIITSDASQKQQIRDLSDAERAVASRCKKLVRAFKLNDSVQEKGDDARIHFGVIAQDVKSAFEAEGLDWQQYAVLCYNTWEAAPAQFDENGTMIKAAREAGGTYGVRYTELLAFIISAL